MLRVRVKVRVEVIVRGRAVVGLLRPTLSLIVNSLALWASQCPGLGLTLLDVDDTERGEGRDGRGANQHVKPALGQDEISL